MDHIPEKVVDQARCEIMWGRSPKDVMTILQAKGVGDRDALDLIEELMSERSAVVRSDGIKKTMIGALCIATPIAYYLFSMWLGYWSIKLFAGLIVLGFLGIAKLVDGIMMILHPRSARGDLASAE